MVPAVVPGGLPSEYLQVEYLESTGTQYIDTGYVPKLLSTDTFTIEFSVLTSNTVIVFGNNNWFSNKSHIMQLPSINYRLRADVSAQGTYFGYCTDGAWNTYTIENSTVSCLNSTSSYDPSYYADNPKHLYLFCQGPYETETFFVGRIRKATYTSNGVPVFDLVPCIRISDSKPGMYDLVGRQFYVNAGTGEFLTGYIADGLVLQMDGINKGAVTGSWVDQVSGVQFDGVNSPTFGTDYVQCSSSSYLQNTSYNPPTGDEKTIEVALSDFSMSTMVVFMGNAANASTFGLYGTKGAMWSNYHDKPVVLTPNGLKTCSITEGLCYVDGAVGTFDTTDNRHYSGGNSTNFIGKRSSGSNFTGKIHAIRIYNRKLSANEMLINQRVDNTRFNLGLTI